MKILIDLRLLTKGGTSGIEEYTRNVVQSLQAIEPNNEYQFFYNGFRKQPLVLSGGTVIDWRIPNKILDASVRFLGWPKIDQIVSTDVVFSPHFNLLVTERLPRVITFHDLSFIHHPQFFSRRQLFWHWLQAVRQQAEQVTKIIAVSEFTKADLVHTFGIDPGKIQVIYSGIGEQFKAAKTTQQHGERPYILYLGTLEPRKNVEALVRAFNLLKQKPVFKDFQLILAGKPGWLYGTILHEVKQSPYGADIILKGEVSDAERVRLYQQAQTFVYPSFFEGFGLPPLEAQASGCPVVAADRTSLPEMLGQSALLVNPWRVEELAEAIEASIIDSKRRASLIAAGLENVKRFSWRTTGEQVLAVLHSTQ